MKNQSKQLINYNIYNMGMKEKIKFQAIAVIVLYLLCFLFYNNHIMSIILSISGLLYPRYKKKDLIKKRKKDLKIQFKEAIYALSSSLGAGQSIESALKQSLMI